MQDLAFYEKINSLENNFTVKIMQFNQYTHMLAHWHEHIELLYFHAGSCRLTINGNGFAVSAGDLVVVNSMEIHTFDADQCPSYTCLLIYPEFFSDVTFPSLLIKNHICRDDYVKNCIHNIVAENKNKCIGSDMILKSHTYRLMAYLLRHYAEMILSGKDFSARAATMHRMNLLQDYIAKHYNEKITTEQLARLCFVSESHFCRFFRNITGKTATGYLNEYRIEKATLMLKNTNKSITAIASSVGFDDVNYFTRVFKKIKKITPVTYRKCHS